MLIVRYRLSSGRTGEDVVVGDGKWTFGRAGGSEVPTLAVDDRRISRTALVIRDGGPGPVVFRGQRGEHARVGLVATDGMTTWLEEGTAGHFTNEARRVEFLLDDEKLLAIEVDFAERGSVVERQRGPSNPLDPQHDA